MSRKSLENASKKSIENATKVKILRVFFSAEKLEPHNHKYW